jgi:hypothetical protein
MVVVLLKQMMHLLNIVVVAKNMGKFFVLFFNYNLSFYLYNQLKLIINRENYII